MSYNMLYRISFYSIDKIYDVFAKKINQDSIYGFVEISEFVFGSTSELVVDPGEERLKTELNGVKKMHVPMHSIIRIDEVEKTGVSKIKDLSNSKNNIAHFPTSIYTPSPSTER